MIIRRALPDEAATLARIALDAKRYWGYPEHWIQHFESDLTISSDFIRDNHVYVAEEKGEIRGFYTLSADKTELEQMWVTPAYLGAGVSKELVLDVYEKILATDDAIFEARMNADGSENPPSSV
jgi:hypothetical protein